MSAHHLVLVAAAVALACLVRVLRDGRLRAHREYERARLARAKHVRPSYLKGTP